MRSYYQIFSLLVFLVFFGCSKDQDRYPASDFEINSQVIQDAFDIPKLPLSSADSPSWSALASSYESGLRGLENVTGTNNMIVEASKGQLPEGVGARLISDISEEGKFTLKIVYAGDDSGSRAILKKILDKLTDRTVLQTYYDFFEWSYNIKNGDVDSLQAFHKIKSDAISSLEVESTPESSKVLQDIETRSQDFDHLAKSVGRERKIAEKARKDILSEIDRAGEADQLKRLVSQGKREEVAQLLEKYLPREQMAPFELKFWNQMLEAIRKPLPLKDRVLVFRGIDEDMIYGAINEAGKELSKEEAVASSKGFMMSSMMTKNQGTWNRRLRSLQTMNDKFLGQHNATKSSEWTKNFRISTFFKQHSRNPQGSPFLSFTPKIGVATQFGHKRAAAYLVDPRALLANTTTSYTGEFEFLTSLVTFPDELVDIYDVELHGQLDNDGRKMRFLSKTKELLDDDASYDRIKKVFDHFNNFSDVAQLETNVQKESFFSKITSIFKKKPVAVAPIPTDPSAKSCTYVLKFLWNL